MTSRQVYRLGQPALNSLISLAAGTSKMARLPSLLSTALGDAAWSVAPSALTVAAVVAIAWWIRRRRSARREASISADDGLPDVYRATTYTARTPRGELRLRVGRRDEMLDALMHDGDATHWAFVTAWNPRSRPTDEAANDRALERLRREIEAHGWSYYEGEGASDDGRWPAEPSFLVVGPARDEAVDLGRRYEQNAVVVGVRGGPAGLVDCRMSHPA